MATDVSEMTAEHPYLHSPASRFELATDSDAATGNLENCSGSAGGIPTIGRSER